MADQFDSKTILKLFVPTILLIFFAVIDLTASLCNSAGGKESMQPVNLGINGSDDVPECNESMSVMRSLLHVSVKELISTRQLNRSIPARGQRNEEIRLGGIQLISFLCGYFFRSTQWERERSMELRAGMFYEFHRARVVSRAGQPLLTKNDVEVGPQITREDAVHQVRNGKDVYTPRRSDAERLAISVYGPDPGPEYDPPRESFHFQHFHPGGEHPEFHPNREGRPRAIRGPGHVFFGYRGENRIPHPAAE